MREANAPTMGVNSWFEDELHQQYRLDHKSVDDGWGDLFIQIDENAAPPAAEEPVLPLAENAPENGVVHPPQAPVEPVATESATPAVAPVEAAPVAAPAVSAEAISE